MMLNTSKTSAVVWLGFQINVIILFNGVLIVRVLQNAILREWYIGCLSLWPAVSELLRC